ncbi:MAG: hypothetical protein H7Y38_18545 [Armatimonadetes bacterium]|nr:hypothetical protein [Armatimonadota bacterium]
MDERRKAAYRYLLYRVCLSLRGSAPFGRTSDEAFTRLTQHRDERTTVHHAWHLAEAFHNLAEFSAHDFAGFKEEWFWGEIDTLKRYIGDAANQYKNIFDDCLTGKHSPLDSKITYE